MSWWTRCTGFRADSDASAGCNMNETSKRLISGFSIGGLVIVVLNVDVLYWILPMLLVMLVVLAGVYEFYSLVNRGLEGSPFTAGGIVFSVLIVLGFYAQFLLFQQHIPVDSIQSFHRDFMALFYPGISLVPFFLILLMIVTLSYHLFFRPLDGTTYGVATTLFGVLYVALPLGHALLTFGFKHGVFYNVLVALITIASDAGAYFAGRWFGKHNAGLAVSPKKTYEGYVGGLLFSVVMGIAFLEGWERINGADIPMTYLEAGLLGLVFSIVSVLGDLAESALKRDAKTKDSASLIPGHGGVLDLIDAMLFTFPLGYYYFYFKQFAGFAV